MGARIYVGNLPYSVSESNLYDIFNQFGQVQSVRLIVDSASGQSKGYGFVDMSADDEAERAIAYLNGAECEGRTLRVDRANGRKAASGSARKGAPLLREP